jgi:hypothetical protein
MIIVKVHILECLKVEKSKLYQNHQRKNNLLKMLNVKFFSLFFLLLLISIIFLIAVCIQSGTKIALFNRLRYVIRDII